MSVNYQCFLKYELPLETARKLWNQCTEETGLNSIDDFVRWASALLGTTVSYAGPGRYWIHIGYKKFEEAESELIRLKLTYF